MKWNKRKGRNKISSALRFFLFCNRRTEDESDSINQSILTVGWSTFFKPIPNDECLLFGFCRLNMREQISAASSSSDVTDLGLDLILPLAACRPQDSTPPLNCTDCVSVCVAMNPQVWTYLSCRYKATHTMAVKSRGHDIGKHMTQKNHELHTQYNHKVNMAVTWRGAMLLYREQDGVWYPQTQVWPRPITQNWQERQIRAYPKNVNLPVLGQGNLPLNRLQLLSSEERGRKREKDIWNQQLCGLYPRVADSVTPLPLWHGTASLHENSYTLFPSFTLMLPVISPPFSNRLDFLTPYICAPDMWKVE